MTRPARVEGCIGGWGVLRLVGLIRVWGLNPVGANRSRAVEGGPCDETGCVQEVLDFPSIRGVEDFVECVAAPEIEHVARVSELCSRA